jgi:hypothetical protein
VVTINPSRGVSVEHRNQGPSGPILKKGHVYLEGTDKDDIAVIFDMKTTSQLLSKEIDVSVANGNEIVLTVAPTEILTSDQ